MAMTNTNPTLDDPRTRARLSFEADVCLPTVDRWRRREPVRASSARRLADACARIGVEPPASAVSA